MKRGDLVTVAASGDYGVPLPAVIVQTDVFPEDHPSAIVCQMTSELTEAPDFRLTIDPTPENGLGTRSQIMVDKPVTVRRERLGKRIGRLSADEIARLDAAIAFVMGLAD
jgi:mRNA interferase MazF